MCLVVFAWQAHPNYRLVLAGNRDESYARPTQDAHWWPDNASILAGRDLQAGGTWLAMSKAGRFAAVTNFRDGRANRSGLRSRGTLVTDLVTGSRSLGETGSSIEMDAYAGFSLLFSDGESMSYLSNRDDLGAKLESGIYGLSNASLDTPWSKVVRAKAGLKALIDNDALNETELLRLLSDRTPAPLHDVAADDLPFEMARAVSAPFIVTPAYGTRSSTIVLWDNDGGVEFCERRFDPAGQAAGDSRFRFRVESGT
jgi:uncharacterized protein with NRDE domain